MSYEKIKSITRKPKEGKIYITSACSNVSPSTYHKWEYTIENATYEEKMLELMRGINGGGLVLNDSCYNWNYAKLKAQAEMVEKHGKDYSLYDLSTMKYTHYCLGQQISDLYTPITQEEITSGNYDYIFNWASQDGASRVYYRAEEYKTEKERVRAVLKEYFEVFNRYLDEKHDGKYYLYSETYGYIKPKGIGGSFYYSPYSSISGCLEIMDYKKAYCIAKNIGRDVEVRKIPKRVYKPTKEQLEEGKTRLKDIIGFDSKYVEKLFISDVYSTREVKSAEIDLIRAVNEFETNYNAYVYHIIYTETSFGKCYSMLYVSNYKGEWRDDRKLLEDGTTCAYVWNRTDEVCSEIGLIGFETKGNQLIRNY